MIGLTDRAFAISNTDSANSEKPVILHISIIDNSAYTVSAIAETDLFLRRALPSARLISVKAHTSRFHIDEGSIRKTILNQLRKRTDSNDVISHLVIDSHGNTFPDNHDGTNYTRLSHLGEISETEVNDELKAILAPVSDLFAKDAKVVFNSCLTFCGTSESAANRAHVFLNELGITDGQIYGAVVKEMDSVGGYIEKGALRRALLDWRQLRFFSAIGAALGLPMAYFFEHGSVAGYTADAALTTASITAVLHVGMQLIKRVFANDRSVNKGRLIIFKNGHVVSNTMVRKYDDKLKIYGAQCSATFANF